ncbi:sugar ABC transporter ATP-binding protein [Aeromicrobium sp. CFBP 8757]|uniref:sugar ABC transporter ATP-binding protein n=1 Tax=Aeromicrobium sp. CFBP 8757 TaxID=2775288 RepID=UPI0017800DC5|nr:sugar ABC transporter ATP-binding protein [Aeromicrobium sp. CFBP 8757]MBD8605437.1 sugar ABC transporter ATP-binding protein [Aeromicrobium sp. CFBP 8757]
MTQGTSAVALAATALELRSVTKVFGATKALDGVDLSLREGEVHALLGQNGCGKSTLIKLLAGFHQPQGEPDAQVYGESLRLGSASSAAAAGLRFVHQDLGVIDDLTVSENLTLGASDQDRRWLSDGRERRRAQTLLDGLGIEIDAGAMVRDLGPAERTMVAVARALRDGVQAARVLVLDEVTAALPADEVALVFELVRRIRTMGGTVLYVSHRLDEVFQIADRVTVLRDGLLVDTVDTASISHDELVALIVGRPLEQFYPDPPAPRDDVVLSVNGLSGDVVRDVSFDVHRGEIVGIAGIDGSGREELPYLLFGAKPVTSGHVVVDGVRHDGLTPHDAIAAGMALIPADRAKRGATPSFSLRENVTLPRIPFGLGRWLSARAERREVGVWLDRLGVVPHDAEATLSTLSGGNQQKVVLARWMRCEPLVMLLDEPTQGVDVGAKASIYELLARSARVGASTVIASTDYEELAAISDRVLIMRDGRVVAEVHRDQLSVTAISELTLAASAAPAPDKES